MTHSIFAQIDGITWQHCYGGGTGDVANEVVSIPGGSAFIGGTLSVDGDVDGANHGLSDIWLVISDESGALQQQYCYGSGYAEYGTDLVALSDGGYFLAATTTAGSLCNNGSFDGWAARVDGTGAILWSHCMGGNLVDYVRACAATPDGGFLLAGAMQSTGGDMGSGLGSYDAVLRKLDGNGVVQWTKRYGGMGDDGFERILVKEDGTIYLIGYSNTSTLPNAHDNYDGWMVRTQPDGTLIDQMTFGGTAIEELYDGCFATNGTIVLTGFTRSNNGQATGNHGAADQWVIAVDQSLNELWHTCVGGVDEDAGKYVLPLNNAILLLGTTESSTGNFTGLGLGGVDYTATMLDLTTGAVNDLDVFGGPSDDLLYGAVLDDEGSALLVGETASNTGDVSGNHGGYDAWVIKLGLSVGIKERTQFTFGMQPNPTKGELTITLDEADDVRSIRLYDAFGRLLLDHSIQGNPPIHTLDMSDRSAGCYVVAIELFDGTRSTQRVIKQ